MNFSALVLKALGWKVTLSTPDFPKSIICVAPHTSNWDFILGELAIHSVGRKSGFLMKSSWFFFPLNLILRAMGGIPVHRNHHKGGSVTSSVIDLFKANDTLNIAITPEGTRKRADQWHTGFLYIAHEAGIPIQLAAIDFDKKLIRLTDYYTTTGNITNDINCIKKYYQDLGVSGKHPDQFSTKRQ